MPHVHSFSPRNTICFSEEDCMHQKVLIISISAVHCALTMECITPFQGMACTLKVSVKVTPQEMLQSLQGNVQREREREATFFKECRNSLQNTTAHRQHIYWMILLETSF